MTFVAVVVLMETDEEGFLPWREIAFRGVPAPVDVLFALTLAAVLVKLVVERRPVVLPEPFTWPLLLLMLAVVAGVVTGTAFAADRLEMLNALRPLAALILLPVVIVNLVAARSQATWLLVGAGVLALVKGIEGVIVWTFSLGRQIGDSTLTFYSPASNFLLLLLVLGVVASIVMRVRLPVWLYVAFPICLAAFVLSFRRNFWIAALFALVAVLLVGSGLRGRAVLAGVTVALVLAFNVMSSAVGASEVEGPIAERVRTLSPDQIRTETYDRYRLDEARNVLAAISGSPLTGIGVGVPWQLVHPLPVEFENGRHYTHVVLLWYWLKLGLLGVAAYVWLMIAALRQALSLRRTEPDPHVRVAALAAFAGLLGLALAETTGSFTGVSYRATVVVAVVLGWLAVARLHRATSAS